jgi:hypothetical protein
MSWLSRLIATFAPAGSGLKKLGDSPPIATSPSSGPKAEKTPPPSASSTTYSPADRDTKLAVVLKRATDDHRVLWRASGKDVYVTYSPAKFSDQFKVVGGKPGGSNIESLDQLWFMFDEDEGVRLEPSWPQMHDLTISVEAQVHRRERAIAEVMEYLRNL